MKKRLSALAGTALVCLGMTPVFAEDGNDDRPVPSSRRGDSPLLVEVTVPALRRNALPSLGSTQISSSRQSTAKSDTAKLLTAYPGADAMSAGGVSGLPFLNGLSDDNLHIQVNGMDILAACANHMNPPLSYIPPAQVGSILVYPTVVPVSVGADAIGGTILVDSPPPLFAAPHQKYLVTGTAGAFFQSNGNIRGANVSATGATRNFSVNYSGSIVQGGNYRAAKAFKAPADGLGADVVGSSLFRSENQSLAAAYRWGDQTVDLRLDYQHIPYQGFPNARMDMTKNEGIGANLHYSLDFHWGNLDVRLYHQNIQHEMNFLADKMRGAPMGMPMDAQAVNYGLRPMLNLFLTSEDTLRIGADYQRYHLNDWWPPATPRMGMMGPNTFWNIRDGRRDRYDVFGEWERRWDPRWTSLLGVRLDVVHMNTGEVQGYNAMMYGNPGNPGTPPGRFNTADRSRTDANWDFSAMLRYRPGDRSALEMGFSRTAQSPNLYELYAWSSNPMAMTMIGWFGDGNGYIGNLQLKPQIANTLSLSAKYHAADPKAWRMEITPYFTYVQNYIGAQRCPPTLGGACTPANLTATSGFVYLQFANQTARLWGVNASGAARLAETQRFGDFGLEATAAYVRGDNLSLRTPMYHIMPANLRLALVQEWGHWQNRIEEVLVAGKTRADTVRNEPETAGYGLLNLRTTYSTRHWQASLALENVLNQLYEDPLGGIYLGQRPFLPGIPLPGMGRSINASMSYSF